MSTRRKRLGLPLPSQSDPKVVAGTTAGKAALVFNPTASGSCSGDVSRVVFMRWTNWQTP